ncbi:MAG TPA: GAF domain-containing protein [Methylomirabilota bacterium]|jgi:GAF domain-containing protein|nr:GAF domain-containing protein [Methylomirabilota bacterium]
MTQEESLATISRVLGSARSIPELLGLISEKARDLVGAHQATTSVVFNEDWAKSVHAVSLSDKYAAWRTYDERPDGSGIYRLVCQLNRPLRLTQTELEAHPAWKGFGSAAKRHPAMRGWLAVPLTGRQGRNIGVIQLSDKYAGEFTAADEAILVELGRLASLAFEDTRRFARAQRRRDSIRPSPDAHDEDRKTQGPIPRGAS